MSMSRIGISLLLAALILPFSGCSIYNKVKAQQELVDGAKAYQEKKFDEAEKMFRSAIARDPSKIMAQVFLARTLHSQFASNRKETAKAEAAIVEYNKVIPLYAEDLAAKKKALDAQPNNERTLKEFHQSASILSSSISSVANLLDTLGKSDEWRKWQQDMAADTELPNQARVAAYTALAARENTCANEISDIEPQKKTVKKDGKDTYAFTKPAKVEDYEKLKGCIDKGSGLIDEALKLETDEVKNASSVDVKSLSNAAMDAKVDVLKSFESAWSYRASLYVQAMRLAEMDGRTSDEAGFKAKAEAAKNRFGELSDLEKRIADEKDARAKAAEENK